jgi:hypothetical protein
MVEDQNGGVALIGGQFSVEYLISINFLMEARMLFGLKWKRR